MKSIAVALCVTVLVTLSCTKKEKFVEPEYIFAKWVRAIEQLNYADYRRCEAFPKSEAVFRDQYRDSYFADPMVNEIEDLDEKNVLKDPEGRQFVKRNVTFECTEIVRKSRKASAVLRGDVDFIRYTDGPRKGDGWLMWNRKMIRISR